MCPQSSFLVLISTLCTSITVSHQAIALFFVLRLVMLAASPSPIRIVACIHRAEVAPIISSNLTPFYTFSHVLTDLTKLDAFVAELSALPDTERPRGWMVGGGWSEEQTQAVRTAVGESAVVVKVPSGTIERFTLPLMHIYITGLLDHVFRQGE